MKMFRFWPEEWGWRVRQKAQNSSLLEARKRESAGMGPWQGILGDWQAGRNSGYLLEAHREALPILDGGIARLVTMDGVLTVEGDNDKLVAEIEEWMNNIQVNDLETGYQAFYASCGNELYEQGRAVGEFVYEPKGRDVVRLRVADSKGIVYVREGDALRTLYRAPEPRCNQRGDGLGAVEDILRGTVRGGAQKSPLAALGEMGYVELDPAQAVYALHRSEADNPYGVSILRSLPFVAQTLLKIQNATGRSWERFGDPSFHIHYSTKNRKITADDALKRAKSTAADLAKAMEQKRMGNSVDLSTAAAADDDIKVTVIGAEGEALEIEQPARAMVEQIVAAFGLPAWMLGISWSQASGIGEPQSIVVLQESETRFTLRRPGLEKPIKAMLRARGRTWKEGDWKLKQRLPSLMDELKRAQANFLNKQAAMMGGESGDEGGGSATTRPRGVDNNLRSARTQRRKASKGSDDDESTGEPWAEDDAALPRLEADTVTALLRGWSGLRDGVLKALGLDSGEETFTFESDMLVSLLSQGAALQAQQQIWLQAAQLSAWDRGIDNAGGEVRGAGKAAPAPLAKADDDLAVSYDFDSPVVQAAIAAARQRMRTFYASEALRLVRSVIARRFTDKIVASLLSGEFDGMNPLHVARELRKRFDGGDYDWERLARSEIAMAQADGKLDAYEAAGVTLVEYVTANDDRVSEICLSLADGNPYPIDECPVPVEDSHPNCRCTVVAVF